MNLGDLHQGTVINLDGQTFLVIKAQHSKQARGGGLVKAKLRNLKSKNTVERTIKPSDNFSTANLTRTTVTFLYVSPKGDYYTFMDKRTFEQLELPTELIAEQSKFLLAGVDVDILYLEEEPVGLELPLKLDFTVTEAEPGLKGNTTQGAGTKLVKIQTQATVAVPLFINQGDIIRVNTQDGSYVERVSK